MAADCVDYDELQTGTRNEGVYAAIFSWFMKASFTIGLSLAGPIVVRIPVQAIPFASTTIVGGTTLLWC